MASSERCERCGGTRGDMVDASGWGYGPFFHSLASDCVGVLKAELERARPVLARFAEARFCGRCGTTRALYTPARTRWCAACGWDFGERAEQAAREGKQKAGDSTGPEAGIVIGSGEGLTEQASRASSPPVGSDPPGLDGSIPSSPAAPSAPSPDLRALRDAVIDARARKRVAERRPGGFYAGDLALDMARDRLIAAEDALVRALNERGTR